ncbi:S1C family serine protease [Rhabdothermincola sp.]|uniref:S1C family serine protease n=1 Tax=Rhabdothermincola sp. TaxID=2820405 RepID=UPI002FE1951C
MAHDDEPDESLGFQPPLPPEDRLWRHPSELGPAGAHQPITIVERPRAPTRTWLVGVVAFLLGGAATLAALEVSGAFDDHPGPPAVETIALPVPKNPGADDLALAEQVLPAVARIDAHSAAGSRGGTGVVIRTDGVLLTSADAVDGADAITVTFNDHQVLGGTLVGLDHENDIAVVKVERGDLPTATIGQPGSLELGERAMAISTVAGQPGSPLVGVGLVSGLGERVDLPGGDSMHGMIRANLRIPEEATGAPLIDESGAVVGVVTRRGASGSGGKNDGENRSGGSTDRGQRLEVRFATPIDWAKRLSDEILLTGRVSPVWLGIEGTDLTDSEIDALGRGGVKVARVSDGSPASQAGLTPGDVVTRIDDRPITTISELIVEVRSHHAGDTVRLAFLRGGEQDVTLVTLTTKSP